MQIFYKKNVLLCVTGGIAAYKSAEITRLFKKEGADVRIIMTESSKEFITPLTLQAVSGNQIHDSLLDEKAEAGMGHIELAKWADILLVAPCTAETLSKINQGRADDLLGTVILATKANIFIAPAMNMNMWLDPTTQSNYEQLQSKKVFFIGPDIGDQACGDVGPGRLVEPEKILNEISNSINTGELSGKTVNITAGPTREKLDPVRYISNNSSGKMGYALAQAAIEAGANVNLISGPVTLEVNKNINLIKINTAKEMLDQVLKVMKDDDLFIGCAAVSDYRPKNYSVEKLKKNSKEIFNLKLEKNDDILSNVSKNYPNSFVVGFAAETENIEENSRKKLTEKNLNMIISNDVSNKSIGFDSDDNEVTIYTENEKILIEKDTKFKVAQKIINEIVNKINIKDVISN
ncbi:MAG: bifunctional phosphopantothenoylcysteine decarboxylase/phosphopantothenate--cysteine ligase CoaBC [SAR86 cluster bacterium]|jgi:phosphopantothenoylcysteine decarboxylase/phosphopantothenate--cysteine ligase|nr:MAG: bifunctional phosphopantothenoylcysteine decarboxylase/phosphopantothenate--cysteine ligase CoaBC [SAR86 cluster bacterium]URQ69034.1 bifunctional phosphopantothenoylcysteine decarboxylase/phosphopantothenate--cysteine ligase CoaBC [SAR86 cluster bacterium]